MKKVFIDGSAGTTGLRIRDRLAQRDDIKLIELPEEKRKDTQARRKALNSADISFLCLPDAAAIEAAELVENENTVILDTSTAHRTAPGWAYGFPELSAEFEAKIISSKRIAVPGCHASGFIALVYPLIEAGLLGMQMYRHDSQFYGGDGIVVKGVENTIRAVSSIARDGMRETDNEIIRLMIGEETVK